ncbi:hypothetical protein EVAR_42777_1 [Eumeta japonica]|uniref:Uncharacterized protein n=1 Tax=Eumeta variegata TaxID=151549 RepID=A0A4C1WN89_EUMVA|nr:hypothetical protein EVAR_42777_1 [Eumeta japonica]
MSSKNNHSAVNVGGLVVVFLLGVGVASENVTSQNNGTSKMAWLKGLLDHHDWHDVVNASEPLTPLCADQLNDYVSALNEGQLWASKIGHEAIRKNRTLVTAAGAVRTSGADAGTWKRAIVPCRSIR